jgi:hypothetical protein
MWGGLDHFWFLLGHVGLLDQVGEVHVAGLEVLLLIVVYLALLGLLWKQELDA